VTSVRLLTRLAGTLLVIGVVLLVGVYGVSNRRLGASFDVPVVSIETSGDSATLAAGARVARIRGCVDCHGEALTGDTVIDVGAIGRIVATNLTPGENGVGATYTEDDWVRAIRSGVRPDGSVLLVMPSNEYREMGPEDVGALVSWLMAAPPRASDPVEQTVGPLGRLLYLAGQVPLVAAELIDHDDARFSQPDAAVTIEYGAYLATSCTACHRSDFAGGPFAGLPPESPDPANITPDVATGIGAWTEADFVTFFSTGARPDGRQVDPAFMPWTLGAAMTVLEKKALWTYLNSLPPVSMQR
jgi:mono/diheme cytochrome c family protein